MTGKPDDISQEAWDAALPVVELIFDQDGIFHTNIQGRIARAIMDAKAEAARDMIDCLSDMTEHYVRLAGSGDCGFWDPEQESEVIAARKMIAAIRQRSLPTPPEALK